MKTFVLKLLSFVILLTAVLLAGLCVLPGTRARMSMLGAHPKKCAALDKITGPRLVFVGGSGLGMGLNTTYIAGQLGWTCYNMGLHAGLGLVYQLRSICPRLRKGDCVVIVPEYANFQSDTCYGQYELAMMVVDVLPEDRKFISFKHWYYLLEELCSYSATKWRLLFKPQTVADQTGGYNERGDSFCGPDLKGGTIIFPIGKKLTEKNYSSHALEHIREFVAEMHRRGVRVLLLPPAYHAPSFENQREYIDKIAKELASAGFPFSAEPQRYSLPPWLFTDTSYHLGYEGRLLRSKLMVEDLRSVLEK